MPPDERAARMGAEVWQEYRKNKERIRMKTGRGW